MRVHGPERLAGQGLDPEQFESGDRAIHALLTDPVVGEQVDLVLTWRAGLHGDDELRNARKRPGLLDAVDADDAPRQREEVALRDAAFW